MKLPLLPRSSARLSAAAGVTTAALLLVSPTAGASVRSATTTPTLAVSVSATSGYEYTTKVTISGRTTGLPTGSPVRIMLGTTVFTTVRTTSTGTFSVVMNGRAAGSYAVRATSAATATLAAASSTSTNVTYRPVAVNVASTMAVPTVGGATVRGTISSGVAGQTAFADIWTGSGWSRSRTGTTTTGGAFSLPAAYGYGNIKGYLYRFGTVLPNGQVRLSGHVTVNRVMPAPLYRFSEADGRLVLSKVGVTITSSGGCSDRTVYGCTSVSTILSATLKEVVRMRQSSGCTVRFSGGTEVGHATSTYSHWNGYKADIEVNACINSWVAAQRAAGRLGTTIYTNEWSHWDFGVRP